MPSRKWKSCMAASSVPKEDALQGPEVCCTPAPRKEKENNKVQTAKKIASMLRNPSAMNSKKQLPKSQVKSTNPVSVRRDPNANTIPSRGKNHDKIEIKGREFLDKIIWAR